jgi:hypothetical protein
MVPGEAYRIKAAEIRVKAHQESHTPVKMELEALALSFLRLAEQAERNARTDVVYEPPPDRPIAQQQQQPHPRDDDDEPSSSVG